MPKAVGSNNLDAWKNAVAMLRDSKGELFNLIVEVADPVHLDPSWYLNYDPAKIDADAKKIENVALTIFPKKLNSRAQTRKDLYQKYMALHQRAMRMGKNQYAWGSYFERLIAFGEKKENQLESAIEKISSWKRRYTTPFIFHISSIDLDSHRPMGAPCWQYGQLIWRENDSLDLLAVYRNHDYFRKALGNFIGLGGLLNFICNQTKKDPGKLIVHSVHAYSESSMSRLIRLAGL